MGHGVHQQPRHPLRAALPGSLHLGIGKLSWAKVLGGSSQERVNDLALDGAGNVLLAGDFLGSASFGGPTKTSAGSYDIFLVKLDSAGKHKLTKTIGGTNTDLGNAVGADAKGNLYLAGKFAGKTDFGGGTRTGYGGGDAYLVKYDASGKFVWLKTWGNNLTTSARALDVSGKGDVVVAGDFRGAINMGCGKHGASGYANDLFVGKLDTSGTCQWSRAYGGTDVEGACDVVQDAKGDVHLAATYVGAVSFGGNKVKGWNGLDGAVVAHSSAGKYKRAWAFGGKNWDVPAALAVGPSGGLFVGGYFESVTQLGSVSHTSNGGSDLLVFKLSP